MSVATVSRILNDKPDVAEATRTRVLQVMDEIGFAPQSAWQQIRSGRTGLIAMHFPQDFNPPAHDVIMTAALGVEEAGYSINIITRSLTDSELLAIFRSRQADGIILLEVLTDDRRAKVLRDHGYPFVMIGHREDSTGMSFVDVDVEHGVDIAMDHLAELGHRRIGFLGLDPAVGRKRYGYATWTHEAYERACERLGLPAVSSVGGLTADDMAEAAGRLLDEHPDVTACVAFQGQSVIGALKAVRARRSASARGPFDRGNGQRTHGRDGIPAAHHRQLPRRRDGPHRRQAAARPHRRDGSSGRARLRQAGAHGPGQHRAAAPSWLRRS